MFNLKFLKRLAKGKARSNDKWEGALTEEYIRMWGNILSAGKIEEDQEKIRESLEYFKVILTFSEFEKNNLFDILEKCYVIYRNYGKTERENESKRNKKREENKLRNKIMSEL